MLTPRTMLNKIREIIQKYPALNAFAEFNDNEISITIGNDNWTDLITKTHRNFVTDMDDLCFCNEWSTSVIMDEPNVYKLRPQDHRSYQ